jgi:hypothetical protein
MANGLRFHLVMKKNVMGHSLGGHPSPTSSRVVPRDSTGRQPHRATPCWRLWRLWQLWHFGGC